MLFRSKLISVEVEEDNSIFAFSAASFKRCIAIGSVVRSAPSSFLFNRSIGLPTHLADIHARPEDLPAVTEKALAGIDVRVWPYPVAQQMLIDAVMELEQVG